METCYTESVFTHVTSIYANLLNQKKVFTQEERSNPTNMAAVLLFGHQYGRRDVM